MLKVVINNDSVSSSSIHLFTGRGVRSSTPNPPGYRRGGGVSAG